MQTQIYYTVNSGLYFLSNETGLFVDGIHQGEHEGCSCTTKETKAALYSRNEMFCNLKGVLYTHKHGDHYDENEIKKVLDCSNTCVTIGTDNIKSYDMTTDVIGDAIVYSIPTTHDGAMFAETPHCSFLIVFGSERFFVAGDAVLDFELGKNIFELCQYNSPNIVFINPLQLFSKSGRSFLQYLNPRKTFIYHIPFLKDDVFAYGTTAKKGVYTYRNEVPGLELAEHMSWLKN